MGKVISRMNQLHECVKKGGSLLEVQHLLDKGQSLNYRDVNDDYNKRPTTLHMFCFSYCEKAGLESLNILQLLLENGAEVDAVDEDKSTPLMLLVEKGFPVDHVDLFLNKGADLSKKDRIGRTVLHYFEQMYETKRGINSLNILKLLLEKGADINSVTNHGNTPLTVLVRGGFPSDHIELLLEKGASVHHKGMSENTILHQFAIGYYSVKQGEESLKILKSFIRYDCDVDAVNKEGDTPLKLLLEKHFPINHIKVILDKGLDIRGRFGYIPGVLHYLLQSDFCHLSVELFQLVLDYGADPNEVNEEGIPILLSCVGANNRAFVRILCEHGTAINLDALVSDYLNLRIDEEADKFEMIFKYALLRDDTIFNNPLKDVSNLRRFVNASRKEVEEMKIRQLNGQVTLYDIVSETDQRTLGEYFRFSDLGMGVESMLEAGFPIYADIIRSRLEIARHWAETCKK